MSDRADGRILVACVGNIFAGDDGFGVEAARALQAAELPECVTVTDYGIRGLDLAYALIDGWRAVILVDAIRRGGDAGDLYLLQADRNGEAGGLLDPHAMDPSAVFALARSLGEIRAQIFIVGCEPASLGDDLGGSMGLSQAVAAAIPEAVEMVRGLSRQLAMGTYAAGAELNLLTT